MRIRSLFLAPTTVAVLLGCPDPAAADQIPQLAVTARIIHSDGGSSTSNSSPHPMALSTGVTSYVFASDSLCGVGGADGSARNLDDLLRQRGHVWKVTRTGVSHADGKLTFDLEWSRYDGGNPTPASNSRQRLTLAEGATYPIDMIRASSPGSCHAAAVMLEISAGTIEAPAFADTVLHYDLWLTHQDSSGQKQTRHFVVSAKQGASGSFEFAPLRFDVPKLAPDQYDFDLVTRIIGAIKGRLRENGKVDVELETRRMDQLEAPDTTKPSLPRAGGRKLMELVLGETVEVELPSVSGFVAHAASPQSPGFSGSIGMAPRRGTPPPAPAVALKDGMIVVSFREFFDGDRFSVLVRVRKE